MDHHAPDLAPAHPAPVVDLDPYDDAVLLDPFPTYAALREAGPAVLLRRYGVYAMGRHRDVQAALKDWRLFSSTGGSGIADIRKSDAWRAPSPIVEVDPPRHTQVRAALNRIISPSVIRRWREAFEREANRLVTEMLERGTFDGAADVSEAFVARVFPDALGWPDSPERRDNLYLLGELNFDGQGPRNARFEETERRAEPILDWQRRMMMREALDPAGFGEQIFQAADRGEIEAEIAPLLLRSFLRGGLDTSSATITAALHCLATHPEAFGKLRADPGLARAVTEEAMRLETPIPNVGRLTTRDAVVDGTLIPADSKVILILAAANRDPAAWDRPDAFDITRPSFGHLALGYGIHMCVGQVIARLEADVLLRVLAARVARLEPAGEPVRRLNNNLRSLAHLPLRAVAA
ncbi:MAG TPA: cytochrome P450 [Acetobacteraceae bacterium]|nr:cytochrome P450 [Acetobacteraceae bacterium]